MHKLMCSLPEGLLKGKKVLAGGDCFPSLHFLLTGFAPKIGFTLVTVPLSEGEAWVETGDFIAHWGCHAERAAVDQGLFGHARARSGQGRHRHGL